ncbi:MAG TPA: hypothetical protein VI278_00205 [Nitrososphaeraceae archaeon]
MSYIDGDGSIIIPKSVRPIIDYRETCIGDKKGAKRQFRHGNLHIREYDNHYTIHRDKIDPRTDPLAHLVVDAPEYLIAILSAIYVGRQIGKDVYKRREAEGKNQRAALCDAARTAFITGSAAGAVFYISSNFMKKIKRSP